MVVFLEQVLVLGKGAVFEGFYEIVVSGGIIEQGREDEVLGQTFRNEGLVDEGLGLGSVHKVFVDFPFGSRADVDGQFFFIFLSPSKSLTD